MRLRDRDQGLREQGPRDQGNEGPREQGPWEQGPWEQGPREQGNEGPREQGPREQGPREQGNKRPGNEGPGTMAEPAAGRVGGARDGLVSWLVMRFQARIFLWIAAAALAFLACAPRIDAQTGAQSSSSQPGNMPASDAQTTSTPYISVNPLANVRYDNRFDASLAMAYDHMKAGPNILQGANLGGLDLSGSMWLTKHWGVESSIRAYVGTSGPAVNDANNDGGPIRGPFVAQYFATAGPEFLGPRVPSQAFRPAS